MLRILIKRYFAILVSIFLITLPVSCSGSTIDNATSYEYSSPTPHIVSKDETIPSPLVSSTPTPYQPIPPTSTATPFAKNYYLSPYLPEDFILQTNFPPEWKPIDSQADALISIDYGGEYVISDWIFVLVAPFPTITDTISSEQIKSFWKTGYTTEIPIPSLLVDEKTYHALKYTLGDSSNESINITSTDLLLETAWKDNAWAIIPFEQLNPHWKVIQIDQISPIDKNFSQSNYLLSIPISIITNDSVNNADVEIPSIFPSTNRDPNKLATVVLTGVTAIVRATGIEMEMKGTTYPATDIRDWLRDADILHINNEVPFAEDCPNPAIYPFTELRFCSRTKYIELLEDIGTDVVELAGDHFQDWGTDAMLYTLDLYAERDWKIYGGGKNLEEGRKPLLLEVNGNKLAFIGCNAKQPGYAQATDTNPGAVHCDMDFLVNQIKKLRSDGYLPIVTYQHVEVYTYGIHPVLEPEFQAAAEAGAIIVSGSQAHQPHAFEFYKDSFIHYGLGNLFFDQYSEGLPTRQAFIDRHVFYDNRHISTELLTIMFIDYARSRPMTSSEREDLLNTVFSQSRWNMP